MIMSPEFIEENALPIQPQRPQFSTDKAIVYDEPRKSIEVNRIRDLDGSTISTSLEAGGVQSSRATEHQYITGIQLYMVEFATTLAASLLFLDAAIIATAIPRITDEFHSLSDVGWYGGAYQLGSAALMPLSGKIYQHFSSKWAYLCFFGVFELGSALCGAATSSAMLIVGRTIAGMGGAGIISGAVTIIASIMPIEKRPVATGILIGFSQLGIVLGPLLGGVLTQRTTWRWCFYINLPIGAVCAMLLVFVRIPDQIDKPGALTVLPRLYHHLDLLGFILFAGCVSQLLTALEFGGNQYAWNSVPTIGLFCGAGVTFLVWYAWNWRLGDSALIPLSTAYKKAVWTSSLMQGLSMASLYIITYYLPIYFQAVHHISARFRRCVWDPGYVPCYLFLFFLFFLFFSFSWFPFSSCSPVASIMVAIASIRCSHSCTLDVKSPLFFWLIAYQLICLISVQNRI
jgi:MFS family permease